MNIAKGALQSQRKHSTLDWPNAQNTWNQGHVVYLLATGLRFKKLTAPTAVPSNLPKLPLNKVLKL